MREVDIGLITDNLPPTTQVVMVDCSVYHFTLDLVTKISMVIIEVHIGLKNSHTSHYLFHHTYGHGRFLCYSVASCPVEKSVYGDKRGDINDDYVRRGFSYQDTIHSYFHNLVESVHGDGRGGERYQTSHYPSHNPGGSGVLLGLSVTSCPVHEIGHGGERVDHSGDDLRDGFRSQKTSHSSFHNSGEIIDGYGKGRYRALDQALYLLQSSWSW